MFVYLISVSPECIQQAVSLHAPHLQRGISGRRHEILPISGYIQGLHLTQVGGGDRQPALVHLRCRRHHLAQGLASAHAPNDELPLAGSGDSLVIIQYGSNVSVGVEGDDLRLLVVVGGQVEDDVVRVSVVAVLEASDDVTIVVAQLEEADIVRESDGSVVLEFPHGLVCHHVPDDYRGSGPEFVSTSQDDPLSVRHQTTGRAQLVLSHIEWITSLKVPDLPQIRTEKTH